MHDSGSRSSGRRSQRRCRSTSSGSTTSVVRPCASGSTTRRASKTSRTPRSARCTSPSTPWRARRRWSLCLCMAAVSKRCLGRGRSSRSTCVGTQTWRTRTRTSRRATSACRSFAERASPASTRAGACSSRSLRRSTARGPPPIGPVRRAQPVARRRSGGKGPRASTLSSGRSRTRSRKPIHRRSPSGRRFWICWRERRRRARPDDGCSTCSRARRSSCRSSRPGWRKLQSTW
mmetsp:Transcript_5517/g.15889  ORF Transcript_5517/g.15889 Transcript_5517/m.15889 type:complete len:233 (+) Transcript_5517:1047-1745(+)